MGKIVKWGIVGAGGVARRRTIPAVNGLENASLQAVMDTNAAGLAELKKEYDIPGIYENLDEMLQSADIDAVYVASPVVFHKEQAIKILEAGKHLLIEKPLGIDVASTRKIMECARQKDVLAGVAMVMRCHDGHEKIKKLISRGKLGQIVTCRAQLTCWFPPAEGSWRLNPAISGGGALMDMGIHCVDLMRYLLDDEVKKVAGLVDNISFDYAVEDSASAMLKMEKGASCYVDSYFNIPDEAAKCFLEIYGTKGSIIANGTIGQDGGGDIKICTVEEEKGYESAQVRDCAPKAESLEFDKINMYAKQLGEFSDCVLTGRPPRTTPEDAYELMKIVEAIYRSSLEEKTVYIDH